MTVRIVPIIHDGDRSGFRCPMCNELVPMKLDATTTAVTCPCGQTLSLAGHCLVAEMGVEEKES